MLAVYDTMQYIQAPVATTCVGQAIGVGAVLLAAGTPGRRALLPHARVVLHQPAARGQGPIPDLILQADELVRMRADIEAILSAHTGQSVQALRADTDRDRVLTARAALEYGIVDQVLGQRRLDDAAAGRRPPDLGREGEHDRARRARPGRARHGCPGQGDRLLAVQVARHLFRQPDERGPQRSGQSRDHLAGGFLAAALDLGEVLRRYPGTARRLGERLPLFPPEGPEPLTEHLPPQGLLTRRFPAGQFLGKRFRRGFPPQLIHTRALGHSFSVRAEGRRRPAVSLPADPIRGSEKRRHSMNVTTYSFFSVGCRVHLNGAAAGAGRM